MYRGGRAQGNNYTGQDGQARGGEAADRQRIAAIQSAGEGEEGTIIKTHFQSCPDPPHPPHTACLL